MMPGVQRLPCLCLTLFIMSSSALAGDRLPVPDETSQKTAMQTVRELYKAEWATAKTPDQKRALAGVLLEAGRGSADDPTIRYVLFRVSRDIASQAFDLAGALLAVDAMSTHYEVDDLEARLELLTAFKKSTDVAQQALLAAVALEACDTAATAQRYEEAQQFIATAVASARKTKDTAIVKYATARSKELEHLAVEAAAFAAATKTLETAPSDPEACLKVGSYLCFSQANWEKGISYLALGEGSALAKIAAQELTNPQQPKQQLTLAESWYEAAAQQKDDARRQRILLHAADWYRRALGGLTGIDAKRAEVKLAEIAKATPAVPSWRAALAPREGLLIQLDFEGLSGTVKAGAPVGKDVLGKPIVTQQMGGQIISEGVVGQGLELTGTGLLYGGPLLNQREEYTVALWFKRADAAASNHLWAERNKDDATVGEIFVQSDGRIGLATWNFTKPDNWTRRSLENGGLAASDWSFVAVCRTRGAGGDGQTYGRLNQASFKGECAPVNQKALTYGILGHEFHGLIDEVRVYSRALSNAELELLYAVRPKLKQ